MSSIRLCALALAFVAGAACSDSSGPDDGATSFSFRDPANDTLSDAMTDGGSDFPALDVQEVRGSVDGEELVVTLRFTSPISPTSELADNSVSGFVEFDVDEDENTGFFAFIDDYRDVGDPQGVEYGIALHDTTIAGDVHIPLIHWDTDDTTWVRAEYGASEVTARIPLADLGGDDGRLTMTGIVGNFDRPTDLLPDRGVYTVHRQGLGSAPLSRVSARLAAPPRARATRAARTSRASEIWRRR